MEEIDTIIPTGLTMQLLPYNELYIRTYLLHSDLVKKLKLMTHLSMYLIQPLFNKKMYHGQVTTDGFKFIAG